MLKLTSEARNEQRELLMSLVGKEIQLFVPYDRESIYISPAVSAAKPHIIRTAGRDVFEATDDHGVSTYYSIALTCDRHLFLTQRVLFTVSISRTDAKCAYSAITVCVK
jgi:hypothetical protein